MEKRLDFQPYFENMSKPAMIDTTPNNEALEEANPFIETGHKGNKVYVCTYCNKAFKFQCQASRHSIVHKEDRPYPCTFKGCDKSFKRADILETHMQRHTGKLPFACDEPGCDRKFPNKPALQYHQVKHANQNVCQSKVDVQTFLGISEHKQHLPPESIVGEEESPLDPETEKEFQQLLATPYNRTQWKVVIDIKNSRQTPQDHEYYRLFFNYMINQMRTLKERDRKVKESKKPMEGNYADFPDSLSQNSFSGFARFTEQFNKDDFKFIDFINESADNAL